MGESQCQPLFQGGPQKFLLLFRSPEIHPVQGLVVMQWRSSKEHLVCQIAGLLSKNQLVCHFFVGKLSFLIAFHVFVTDILQFHYLSRCQCLFCLLRLCYTSWIMDSFISFKNVSAIPLQIWLLCFLCSLFLGLHFDVYLSLTFYPSYLLIYIYFPFSHFSVLHSE